MYDDIEDVKQRSRNASYEELRTNPKQLDYDSRAADALEGKALPQIDTRTNRDVETEGRGNLGDGNRDAEQGQSGNLREGLSDPEKLTENAPTTGEQSTTTPKSSSALVDENTDYGTVENPNTANLARAFAQHFNAKHGFTGIVEARKFAAELLGGKVETGSEITKKIDEAIEVGVVLAARKIVELARAFKRTSAETYNQLLDLYNRQPNLSSRTSTSISQQAYSTPAPLAFVSSRLAGITQDSAFTNRLPVTGCF